MHLTKTAVPDRLTTPRGAQWCHFLNSFLRHNVQSTVAPSEPGNLVGKDIGRSGARCSAVQKRRQGFS